MSKEAIEKLEIIFAIVYNEEPDDNEPLASYPRIKKLANETLTLLKQQPPAGEFTKKWRKNVVFMGMQHFSSPRLNMAAEGLLEACDIIDRLEAEKADLVLRLEKTNKYLEIRTKKQSKYSKPRLVDTIIEANRAIISKAEPVEMKK